MLTYHSHIRAHQVHLASSQVHVHVTCITSDRSTYHHLVSHNCILIFPDPQVNLLSSQSALIEKALQSRIDSYKGALTSAGQLVAQAIEKHSSTMLSKAKSMQAQAQELQSTLSKVCV
jgi:hypothetical protein